MHEEYDRTPFYLRRGVLMVIAALVIVGLLLPLVLSVF